MGFNHTGPKLAMYTTRSRTGQKLEIEPFIIHFDTPDSTPDSTPLPTPSSTQPSSCSFDTNTSDTWPTFSHKDPHKYTYDNLLTTTDEDCILDFLFSPILPSRSLYEILAQDHFPHCRAAIMYYLQISPVIQTDVSALVAGFLDDSDVMFYLAANIGWFSAQEFISEPELEYLLMQVLTCKNPEGMAADVAERRLHELFNLTKTQIESCRKIFIPREKLDEQIEQQRLLKHLKNVHHDHWKYRAKLAKQVLPPEHHVSPDVPLPYGCSTLAQVFTDVNEIFRLDGPPSSDWAQTKPPCNGFGHRKRGIKVKMPCRSVDKREPQVLEQAVTEPLKDDEVITTSKIPAEMLFTRAKHQQDIIVVNLSIAPDHMCR